MRRRPTLPLIIVAGMVLLLGACSGAASSQGAASAGEASQDAGGEPSTAGEPSSGSEPSAAPAASDGGGGSVGDPPAPADGPWTGGQGQVTVSGAVSYSTDEPLTTDLSETFDGGTTKLIYNSDEAFVTFFINSTNLPFQASVGTPDFDVSGEDCDVTWAEATETSLDATFSCVVNEFYWYGVDEEPTGEIIIAGTITATR
jgi:hypothetical protein